MRPTTSLRTSIYAACGVLAPVAITYATPQGQLGAAEKVSFEPVTRVEFHKLALSGEAAPGISGPSTFLSFQAPTAVLAGGAPTLDAEGNAGLVAHVVDPANSTGTLTGTWKEVDGVLQLVAVRGASAPGTAGDFESFPSFYFLAPPSMVAGGAGLSATVREGIASQFGFWTDQSGSLSLVAKEGDPIPGMPLNATFRAPYGTLWKNAPALISAAYSDDDDGFLLSKEQEGFWRLVSGSLQLVVCDDMQAPGTGPGTLFGDAGSLHYNGPFDRWDTNGLGQVAFSGTLKGPGVGMQNDEGVWIEGPSGLQLVVREGDPAPVAPDFVFGTGTGVTCFGAQQNTHIRLNAAGAAVFGAQTRGNGHDYVKGLFKYHAGQIELVAVASSASGFVGDPQPGMPAGHTFNTFLLHAELNDAGVLAFEDLIAVPQNGWGYESGIWWDRPGHLALVARTEATVPGLGGAILDTLDMGTLTNSGFLTMTGTLRGAGIGTHNDAVFLIADPSGTLHTVLRAGDTIDVQGDGSDLRTVQAFGVNGVNERLQLGVLMEFTDGSSGAFRMNVRIGPAPKLAK